MRLAPLQMIVPLAVVWLLGCSSTSGLLLRPGPHKLLWDAEDIAEMASHPAPFPRELTQQALPEYLVEPGDVLLVEATDLGSTARLPGDQAVKPDGTIDLGRYGSLRAVGKTVDEIEAEAQRRVDAFEARQSAADEPSNQGRDERTAEQSPWGAGEDQRLQLNVRLIEPTSKVYYVTGEVNAPGAYALIGRETVLDAIIEAGDLTDRANRHKIILSRPSGPGQHRRVLPICYRQIVQLGDTTTNFQIQPGDRIFVSSLTFWEELGQSLFPHLSQSCPVCAQ